MRRELAMVGCVVIVGCGSSASDTGGGGAVAPSDPPVNEGQTPDDNAKQNPPVGGSAPKGVYVSSSLGKDSASGSQDDPFRTLAAGIALAKTQNLPVNACAESYPEAVTLVDGVSVYGYFDCKSNWVRGTTNATIASPTSPALTAKAINLPTRFAGFDVRAPDFDASSSADAPASIALSVSDSTNLTFTSVLAHAGKGAPGVDGTEAAVNNASYGAGSPSHDQLDPCANAIKPIFCTNSAFTPSNGPGPGGTVTCSIGGAGNAGGASGATPIFRFGNVVSGVITAGGLPGAGSSPGAGGIVVGTAGTNGMPGGSGAAGTDGANGQWALTADGFTVGNGGAGSAGGAGSGGGGGAAAASLMSADGLPVSINSMNFLEAAGGASGGAGGCAGQAGTPGTGGGASIAALIVRSTVTFEQGRLESAAGGRAGKGALGSAGSGGQPTGPGFTRGTRLVSGGGGKGGDGGRGGVSGHGAPGPSIALAYMGTRPTLTATDLTPGPAGEGQPALTGAGTLPAVTGVAEAEHVIQ